MKKINLIAAGLGWDGLERFGMTRMAGLEFSPKESCFPAVTCVAQANLRTGLTPAEHGMIANGWWDETLKKPLFWEQSAKLVKGKRVWSEARAAGEKIGMFFFQQSLGEEADLIISPAPIHKHGGGMIMSCYTKPTDLAGEIEKRCGKFPLWRYWGPLASPKVGRKCIAYFEQATEICDVDEAYLYLPTLDYTAQKYGPSSRQHAAALREFRSQLETLVAICERRGCGLSVQGDYEITEVTAAPVAPNVTLRKLGFFKTRRICGMAYPDFYESTAFAMCDHEFCVVYGEKRDEAVKALLATGEYEERRREGTADNFGERRREGTADNFGGLLLAKSGSWCEYRWWTDPREAPDFASHVDIHNKPGFDPKELFFFNRGTVRGTHGRQCRTACGVL